MDYLYSLSGFAVGAIVGLTGVGGGSLMTPLLVLLFGVPPGESVVSLICRVRRPVEERLL